MKAFISGGDAVSAKELLDMQQVFGVQIINGYGNNEVVGAAIVSPRFATNPSSIGIPFKGVEIHAFSDNNEILETNSEGELCISSDNLFVEYIDNPEETNKIKKFHNGKMWIHTGDLGYIDDNGFVYITGRSKRLIKRRAFKIAPETIERVILDMTEVMDCVVVAVDDKDEGEVPFVFVQGRTTNGSIEEMIRRVCADTLPDYEIPKYIVEIEEMPYKNSKHDFGQLSEKAKEYVKNLTKTNY